MLDASAACLQASLTICCCCRSPAEPFNPAHLKGLASLQELHIKRMNVPAFAVPSTWQHLQLLALEECCGMIDLPSDPSALSSLVALRVVESTTRLRFTKPLSFVTQLSRLRSVTLGNDPMITLSTRGMLQACVPLCKHKCSLRRRLTAMFNSYTDTCLQAFKHVCFFR